MLNIAYIANGKSTNRYHLPFVLKRKDKLKVKTIYSPNVSNSKWEKIEGIKYTSNIDDILNDKEINLVVICTKPELHYEYAKMALDNGKNVLVEKPFMIDFNQAKEIFEYAKEKNLLLQCYQNRRYDSDFLTVKEVIKSGKLGDIIEVEMHFDYYRPEVPEHSTRFEPLESYLYGHASHTVDQAISFFGKPDKIVYDVRCLLGNNKMNDYFDLDLFYSNLKVSIKSSYFRIKKRPSFIVYGKKGMFIKETPDRQEEHLKMFYMPTNEDFGKDNLEHYGTITYIDSNGYIHEEKVPTIDGDYGRVYDALYDSIILGKEPIVKEEETLLVMKILEEGIKHIS